MRRLNMRYRLNFKALALAGGLLAMAGTAWSMGGVVILPASYYSGYKPTVLSYAAAHGGVLVEVQGNPFEVPKDDLERIIVRVMARSHFGPDVAFVTTPPDNFVSPYRVVLLFDSKLGYTALKLCGYDAEANPPQTNGVLRVHAALCANEKPLTSVSGYLTQESSPDDARFRQLIGQITTNLFPPRDPNRGGDHRLFDG